MTNANDHDDGATEIEVVSDDESRPSKHDGADRGGATNADSRSDQVMGLTPKDFDANLENDSDDRRK